MKRILSMLLAIVMLFSFAACSSSLAAEETDKETAEEATKTEEKKEEVKEKDTSPIVYPEGFSAGFGRTEVNPPVGVGLGGYGNHMTRLSR